MDTFCIEAEESILASVIQDNAYIDLIKDIPGDAFYLQEHRHIFSAIQSLIKSKLTVDLIGISSIIKATLPGIIPFLESLVNKNTNPDAIKSHLEIMLEKYKVRSLSTLHQETSDSVLAGQPIDLVLQVYNQRLASLYTPVVRYEPKHISDALASYRQTIKGRLDGTIKPIATGHAVLDRKLGGGLKRGTLVVIAARPGMGKTAFSLSIARNASVHSTCLFLSMEMGQDQILDRNVSAVSHVPINFLTNPKRSDTRWEAVRKASADLSSRALYVDDQPALTISMINNKAQTLKNKVGLDLLIIDQLSMIAGAPKDKLYESICDYTRNLVRISKELDLCVILVCQLNRECEKRINRRPVLSDLAMSSSVEQDADTVMMLYRDEVYNKKTDLVGKVEVDVVKQRQGPTGVIYLNYIGNQTRFEDIDQYDVEE